MRKKTRKNQLNKNVAPVGAIVFIIYLSVLFFKSGGVFFVMEVLPIQVIELYEKGQVMIENDWNNLMRILGKEDVFFKESANRFEIPEGTYEITDEQRLILSDFDTMRSSYFISDSRTYLIEDIFDVDAGISADFTIEMPVADEPKVLIFHTHANEYFIDSDMEKGLEEGVVGVGAELQRILKEDYGLEAIHYIEEFDILDGEISRTGAYERMDSPVKKLLELYPSIEIALDIHRDGVGENVHLAVEYEGESFAKIMFVNGITTLLQDGEFVPVANLENPYLQETLGFSLQMQIAAENQFPNATRKIFLNPYRLSTHMLPRSALVEVGAQTNTKQEAKNSMRLLAKMLSDVVLE